MAKKYMSVEELADYLSLTPMSIYKRVSRGEIPYIRVSRSCLRFDIDVIDEWMKSKEVATDGSRD